MLTSIQPHPLYRLAKGLEGGLDGGNKVGISLLCSTGCKSPPPIPANATCNRPWVPNYVANGDSGCECLAEYKCCGETCPPIDKTICWGEGEAEKGKGTCVRASVCTCVRA